MKLVFRNNFLFRCWLVLLVGMACCTQPLAQDIQLEENFDVLGAAFGEFGLDDASSKFFPGQDAPALMSGVRPASCGVPFEDPIVDGCAGAMSRLVEVSPGDWAFWTENWSFGVQPENRFNNGIRSDLAVARADSPECVFRVFGDSCVPFPGEAYPRANGPHGPFHQIAGFAGWGEEIQGQANAMERDIELGMTFWSGWKNYHEEGGGGGVNDATGPILAGNNDCFGLGCPSGSYRRMVTETTNYHSSGDCLAMGGNSDWAEQKATGSYWYRATLGPVTGGVQGWSTDSTDGIDGTWVVVTGSGNNPIDTRGDPVDTNGPGGSSTVGNAATVYLGFSAFKHTMIDDITLRSFAPPPNAAHHWLYF